jgi:hypothetical protein
MKRIQRKLNLPQEMKAQQMNFFPAMQKFFGMEKNWWKKTFPKSRFKLQKDV